MQSHFHCFNLDFVDFLQETDIDWDTPVSNDEWVLNPEASALAQLVKMMGKDEATQRDYSSFVNYYIHQVNLMRYLLGEDYQVSYADPSGVLLAVQSASGIAGTIEMSPYRTSIDWQEEALIAFERGYVKLELPAPLARNRPGTVTLLRDPGEGKVPETVVPQLPWIHAMRQQALHFVRAVRGEAVPLSETAEGLKDLQVARDYIRMLRQ